MWRRFGDRVLIPARLVRPMTIRRPGPRVRLALLALPVLDAAGERAQPRRQGAARRRLLSRLLELTPSGTTCCRR